MTAQHPSPAADTRSLQLSVLFCLFTLTGFLLASEKVAHWFVIPVFVCGVIIGVDAFDWFRGRVGVFDPAGIIGLLGVHFFFLAPLLHVVWDVWLPYIEPPRDWRDWLGGMASINAVGLLMYRYARERASMLGPRSPTKAFWQVDRRRLLLAAICGMLLSGALQCWVYARSGGVLGFVEAYSDTIGNADSEYSLKGWGWIFVVSESFPVLAMILFAVWSSRSVAARSWLTIVAVLFGYFLLRIFFGGLLGSRSNTVFALFWAAGIVHFWIRPITRGFVFAGLGFLAFFMYLYGFYKELGVEALAAFEEGSLNEKDTRRSFQGMLLGDLGRADVHAFLLHRLWKPDSDYQYAWGRTYLGSIALLVPASIWPDRPPHKTKEGTDAEFGAGTYDEGRWYSSHVYGIAGETMLNFGPFPVPLAYMLFGMIVGRLRRFLVTCSHHALPCIGSSVGGTPELLAAEDTLPPNDASALARKILEKAREYRYDVLSERRRGFYGQVKRATAAWLKGACV
jgi:hypothetical protein